jgi:predicted Zn finger-like uncharacterized protein
LQAQCTQCQSRIQIDDSKVPDKPFKVKCPKCQAVITLPGRGAALPGPGNGGAEAVAPAPAAPPPPAYEPPPPGLSAAAIARRERAAASPNDAIIALAGPAAAGLQASLISSGFNVDMVDDIEEGARVVESGIYEVAVTSREQAEPGKPETLQQRLLRMPTDTRRRVFVILVGEEFRTGDGVQAWAAQADLVVHPNDAARCDHLIRATMQERKRLYQPLEDARKRIESI